MLALGWVCVWLVAAQGGGVVDIASLPPGATVRLSRPDSPGLSVVGVTPLRLHWSGEPGCRLEFRAPGCLPHWCDLTPGTPTLAPRLTLWRDDLAAALAAPAALRPSLPAGLRDWGQPGPDEPASDGAGVYTTVWTNEEAVAESFPALLYWRPWDGPARLLARIPVVWQRARRLAVLPEAASSPDGRWLAYGVSELEAGRVEIRRRDGAEPRVVARWPARLADLPVWSADGAHLYYVVDAGPTKSDGRELHRVGVLDGRDERLAAADGWCAPSPDGQALAYRRGGTVVCRDLATGSERELATGVPCGTGQHDLSWSPDSRWVGCAEAKDGRLRVTLLPRDGGASRLLTFRAGAACWLPDSSGLLVDSAVVGLDGRPRRELAPCLRPLERLAWTPDGRALLLSGRGLDGAGQAGRLALDGGWTPLAPEVVGSVWEAVPLREGALVLAAPVGQARGQGRAALWRVSADGTRAERVGEPLTALHSLTASADGRLVFALSGWPDGVRLHRFGAAPGLLPDAPGDLESVALSPDGRWLALGRRDGTCALAGLDGRPVATCDWRVQPPCELTWSRDSRWFQPRRDARWRLGIDGQVTPLPAPPRLTLPADAHLGRFELGPVPLASPDGARWVALGRDGSVWLADRDGLDQPRRLHDPWHSRYGPWLSAARPGPEGREP